jgi:hypothetical protein
MKYEGLNDVRKSTSLELAKFLTPLKKGSGLCYLRGRRRVGKSTILQDFHQRKEFRLYYFSGILDESNLDTLRRFTKSWAQYSENTLLDKIRDKELNWDLIFQDIVQFAKTNTVHIALDEIQWIAKNQSGFIGTLKNHWLSLEATKNCRIIICGSSNKFFKNFTGGEEQILRGLKTRSDIVLPPFSLSEIHQKYGKNLKQEQTALLYMLLGGIPYYWNQLDFEKNFIQLLNQAFAESSTIFLEEVDEILRLEFNQAGVKTIKKILKTLGLRGAPLVTIQKKTKLPTGTLADSIEKLCEYNLLFEKTPVYSKKTLEIRRGSKYVMKDFYLNSYFTLIKPNEIKIRRNENQLLINDMFRWPTSFYHIENFTGESFENLIEYILTSSRERHEGLFKKLELQNINFEVGTHWDKNMQIDLVLHRSDDQQDRWIECKWTNSLDLIRQQILDLEIKQIPTDHKISPKKFLAIPIVATKLLREFAEKHQVGLIEITDLF